MASKKIEPIAPRLRSVDGEDSRDNALQHLEAARKKLARLQEGHDQLALSLAQSVSERHDAVRELERLRAARQQETLAVYRAQEAIIDDLRAQLRVAIQALERIAGQAESMRFSPTATRALLETADQALTRLGRRL